ncbi:AT hook motif-containing protein, putative [Babesia ovata]|uniref:AT hook motif-containing protein, putative n=1 Tax=Babesia ovata TaxID=189622 RepID=A0A2H6K9S2_9APIC|nr:AT hook motif-containing protein, putative [Babesia ovata]GBE59741.1 AT hook motif-containing protein, putative [Babesia ovata]
MHNGKIHLTPDLGSNTEGGNIFPMTRAVYPHQHVMPAYALSGMNYQLGNEQLNVHADYNSETVPDAFYDGIVNPMYNFESPYLYRENTSNVPENGNRVVNGGVKEYPEGAKLYTENERPESRFAYGTKEAGYYPGWHYNGYQYMGGYGNSLPPTMNYGVSHHPKHMAQPHAHMSSLSTECDMSSTQLHYSSGSRELCQHSTYASDSTQSAEQSVASESSPMMRATSPLVTPPKKDSPAMHSAELNVTHEVVNGPLVYRNGFSGAFYNDQVSRQNGEDIGDRGYMDNGFHGEDKHVVSGHNGWNDITYPNYVAVSGMNTMKDAANHRHAVMPRFYNVPQAHYVPPVVYHTNGWAQKGYGGDTISPNRYAAIPDGTSYYDQSTDIGAMKSEEYLDRSMTDINGNQMDQSNTQHVASQLSGVYDYGYDRGQSSNDFYNQGNMSNSGTPQRSTGMDYGEEPLESSPESSEGINQDISIESQKILNRSNIDFLRMSDSLWQTLRSTGMFKLGNKGRAILKSKISKQLKMNPQLRMRALCISGVRRATTRQLFQLAQICGIKSHLK